MPWRGSRLALAAIAFCVLCIPATGIAQDAPEEFTDTITESGRCANPQSDPTGASWSNTYPFDNITFVHVEVTLSWSDDETRVTGNDYFTLSVSDGTSGNSGTETSDRGSITIEFDVPTTKAVWDWTIQVQLVDAGRPPGPLGIIGDSGNAWDLTFTYTYSEYTPDDGGGPQGPPPEIAALYDDPIFWTHVVFMIASTYMFGLVGVLALVALVTRKRWADDASRLKQALSTNRPFRAMAVHAWLVFAVAAVPLGMYVAGKAYGWENAWTSFPAVWNPWFYDIKNADNVSFIVLVLWAIPLWLNRRQLVASRPHAWLFGRIGWFRRLAAKAPEPVLSDREMALLFFVMGIFVWLVFMVQSHGN
jgi:hypothetical protein